MRPATPPNQSQRLEALRRYRILDTPVEASFEDVTRLAARVCQMPIAVITLVDECRQWFKSEIGVGLRETPLDDSICAHAILQPDLFVVPDLKLDHRFAENVFVAGAPHLRFYAGAPLETPEGHRLGTLCVLDLQPRELTDVQQDVLRVLARQVMAQLELRRSLAERDRAEAERARSAAQLKEQEERLGLLFDQASVGMAQTDLSGRFLLVNQRYAEILGRQVDDVLGRTFQEVTHPDDLPDNVAQFRRLQEGGPAFQTQKRYLRPDGSSVWVHNTVSLRRPADGGAAYAIAVSQDITERRRAEEHLRQAQRMEAVGKLAGGIAHDLNNMLVAILGYTSFVSRQLPPEHPVQEDLGLVSKAADRSAALTRQLLAFARRDLLQPRLADLNQIVRDAERLFRPLLGESVEVTLELAPGPTPVFADRGRLEQVLVNLAVNARDAMPQGGRFTLATSVAELDGAFARRYPDIDIPLGRYVRLSASDTGHGMDAATLARVFDPFFTTKAQGEGTGLGLSMVYGTVKQSGGFVWGDSELGQGTTFTIYLPETGPAAEEPTPAAVAEVPAAGTPMPRRQLVLVVDDEELVRDALCRGLEDLGYGTLAAADGGSAARLLAGSADPVDLVVADVVMAGMSGREVGERLRQVQPGVPVLYMSGLAAEEMVRRGLLDPRQPFLQKPFTPETLGNTVRAILDRTATGR